MNETMERVIPFGRRNIGPGHSPYIIAEIGINHNGDLELARKMIKAAKDAGADAVKFQKRTPEDCVPPEQREKMRETPWGYISYLEYRYKIEFGEEEYRSIDETCKKLDIDWFTSCWDVKSVDMMECFNPIGYKVPSAHLINFQLLQRLKDTGRPILLSTGMSTMDEIKSAVAYLQPMARLAIAHCTSSYPAKLDELNLSMIQTLMHMYDYPIGYSGHEVGLATSVAAVALGASFVERHFTLDRALWGSDQAASVEPVGMSRLVKDIRSVFSALGDGKKVVYESEMEARKRLRTC